jgi:hypothetical protein
MWGAPSPRRDDLIRDSLSEKKVERTTQSRIPACQEVRHLAPLSHNTTSTVEIRITRSRNKL